MTPTNGTATSPLLVAEKLSKFYPSRRVGLEVRRRWVRAVDGIDLKVTADGTTVGVVGESGSGKSTMGRLLLGLEPPMSGRVAFEGRDVNRLPRRLQKRFRSSVKAVFQDPFASLDPRMSISEIVSEALRPVRVSGAERTRLVGEALAKVGLQPSLGSAFPGALSGGMRQRVAIARAIVTSPKAIILDEPTSALDVSVRAQILNLLKDIQDTTRTSYVLISHDLSTMRFMSDQINVMYAGEIIERANNEELFKHPLHPYTKLLIDSALPRHPQQRSSDLLSTSIEFNVDVPVSGCRFRNRCAFALQVCANRNPELKALGDGHEVACHLY